MELLTILILIAVIGNFFLGFVVLFRNFKGSLNRSFGLFAVITAIWVFTNFIFEITKQEFPLRLAYSLGAFVPITGITWIYFFDKVKLSIGPKILILILSLISLFFSIACHINNWIVKTVDSIIITGPLFHYYTIYIFLLILIVLIKISLIFIKSEGLKKKQSKYILFGLGSFALISLFVSIILPSFNVIGFSKLDSPSSIFFILFSAYAILKHHLFDIRVIATELLTFAIWIFLLVRTLLSEALRDWIINGSLFVAVFIFGILLIRSVIREVELREKVKRAYEVEKEARKQVEELTEAKTQFIMATQHHLRTPLTSMIGYLDLLFGGTYGKVSPSIKETLLKFQVSTKRLIRVVNALLDISQFQMGKRVVALEPGVDFESLIKEVMEELRFEVKIRGLYFKYEKIGAVSAIKADSEKLKVALFNIIDNAIKYTKQGGITVNLKQVGKSVQLSVKDTGIGVDPKQAKKLFREAFARGDEAKKVHGFGRGIGVYITGHIIRAHNGKIWAESEGKDKGTTFFIELPVS